MTYVPPRFIPDADVVLGDEAPEPVNLGPTLTEEEIAKARAAEPPECPVCGTSLMNIHGSEADYCPRCEERDPRTAQQERRRQERLRRAHNDGNFMPKSVSEWYGTDPP